MVPILPSMSCLRLWIRTESLIRASQPSFSHLFLSHWYISNHLSLSLFPRHWHQPSSWSGMFVFNYYLGQSAASSLRKQATKKKSWLSADYIATTAEQNGWGKKKRGPQTPRIFHIHFQMAYFRDDRTSQKIAQDNLKWKMSNKFIRKPLPDHLIINRLNKKDI